jgi:uncharacterized protein YkwD
MSHPFRLPRTPAWCLLACAALPALARADELASLVNAYRAAPLQCAGAPAAPVPPLATEGALARVRIRSGTFLESALSRQGYESDRAEAITVTGPDDAAAAMDVLRQQYCGKLLSGEFSAIGTAHMGKEWQVVLAHPLILPALPDWQQAGRELVGLVNAARAQGRTCGGERFGPAGPLAWNPALAQAALAHSTDMATRRYFNHIEPNGSTPADRAARAGYRWLRVGENIASGQHSVQEAMTSWLDSPGHCANIMNPGFTEMGAAYAVRADSRVRTPYWTQVFGTAR